MDSKSFHDGPYDLNIIGVRNLENNANQYDDKLHVCYLSEDGHWKEDIFQVSTDLTAAIGLKRKIIKRAQCISIPNKRVERIKWAFIVEGYEALVQWRPVEYWRDGNKDKKADYGGEVFKDVIGLNIHRSSIHDSDEINRYSAGCIVFSKMADWEAFMKLVHKQKRTMGYHTFTFTLIAE